MGIDPTLHCEKHLLEQTELRDRLLVYRVREKTYTLSREGTQRDDRMSDQRRSLLY